MLPITRATAQQFCRVCLQEFKIGENDVTHSILSDTQEVEKWLRQTISNERLRIEIEQLEYPNRLCQNCFMKTDIFYKFRERIYCCTEVLKELCSENLPDQIYQNLQQFCRICLAKRDRIPNVLASAEQQLPFNLEQTSKLRSWLEECGGIRTDEVLQPLFPKIICQRCHNKLNNFIEYRDMAQQSTQYLQSVLECREDEDEEAEKNDDIDKLDNNNIEMRAFTPEKIEVTPHVMKLEELSDAEEENQAPNIFVEQLPEIRNDTSVRDDGDKHDVEYKTNDDSFSADDTTESEAEIENPLADGNEANNVTNEPIETMRRTRGRPRKLPTTQEEDTSFKRKRSKRLKAANKKENKPNVVDQNNSSDSSSSEQKNTSKHGTKYSDHKQNIYCQHCPRKFRKQVLFDAHMQQKHSQLEKPFTCTLCNKSYRLYSSMLRHTREIHEDKTENSTKSEGQLSKQITLHYCEFCCKPFKRKDHLRAHVQTVHEKKRPYKCSYCEKSFGAPKTKRVHEMSHRGEYPFSCEFCSKRFRQITYLNAHLEQHTANPALLCPICKRAQTDEQQLQQHIEKHNCAKIFQCTKCGKILTSRAHLREHENAVHLKLRPFKCRYCDASFSIRQTCQAHEFIHTGERPLLCANCGMSFRHRSTLYLHLRKRHPEELQNPENINFINLKKQDFKQQPQLETMEQSSLTSQELNDNSTVLKTNETSSKLPLRDESST